MQKQATLIFALLALLVCGCSTPKKYGAQMFVVNLDSDPPGATLYLLHRNDYLAYMESGMAQDLESHLVQEHGGVAPAEGVKLKNWQHVLVGKLGDATGTLDFKPTGHHQTFTVTIVQP